MESKEVRNKFLEFFREKGHKIVPSAPMVIKNDPTLMFTNAGMNPFKDYFLGNKQAEYKRVADTQKCLRVSGKHNDLEEVGHDTYHHTMFEMLGNWSFGDYFKKEAIEWAFELLTEVYKISPERLYVTYFGGDSGENLETDVESRDFWKNYLPETHILEGSKKDNFWEMGDTGPCGPCSEIHIDLRNDEELKKIPGYKLVNKNNPEVIELWNLVFIQYNRLKDGTLESLPEKHVDTGMGLERLCMVLQNKKSNYDTDLFQPIIQRCAELTGVTYGKAHQTDVALRVVADHLRAVSFAIADGQLPSNNKAGYVIRRILRRAIRYAYTFLNQNNAFIYTLVPVLGEVMGDSFPEINQQKDLIQKVIKEEEENFLRTLESGIKLLNQEIEKTQQKKTGIIPGKTAFTLYDTYGFPFDLTQLIARENGLSVDEKEFEKYLQEQKDRSRKATKKETSDWIEVHSTSESTEFVGYEMTRCEAKILKYRKVRDKKSEYFHVVLDKTPFYAESGGQVGDKGFLIQNDEQYPVFDTIKEHEMIVHLMKNLPQNPEKAVMAVINESARRDIMKNHSATHLLHHALRNILGTHVEQKGSLVEADRLRFDFSHFRKLSREEIRAVEMEVNRRIQENISRQEFSDIPFEKAIEMGAMALFGEKYGEKVRVIKFDDSVELCGGTHVKATGEIGFFKIISESAIAAGVRRIEALTGKKAVEYIQRQEEILHHLCENMGVDEARLNEAIVKLQEENKTLKKSIERLEQEKSLQMVDNLAQKARKLGDISLIKSKINIDSAAQGKNLVFSLGNKINNAIVLLGGEINQKAHLWIFIDKSICQSHEINAGQIIREIAKEIDGGGGGQNFFATAGGKNPAGIEKALNRAEELILKKL